MLLEFPDDAPEACFIVYFQSIQVLRKWEKCLAAVIGLNALEDAKGDGGLADYEVRGYIGWNHHIAMVFMAMLFFLEMQDKWKLKAPLLTYRCSRNL